MTIKVVGNNTSENVSELRLEHIGSGAVVTCKVNGGFEWKLVDFQERDGKLIGCGRCGVTDDNFFHTEGSYDWLKIERQEV